MFVALVLASVALYEAGPLRTFLEERESFGSELQGQGTGRLELAEHGVEMWLKQPLLGHGPGSHEWIMGAYFHMPPGARAIHNSLTGNLLEAGVLGGLSVLVLFVGFTLSWVRGSLALRRSRSPAIPTLIVGAVGVMFAAFIVSDVSTAAPVLLAFGALDAIWSRLASAPESSRTYAEKAAGAVRRVH
jgi:O-antigen ligase